MATTIGQPVKFKGKAIIAKKKGGNGAASLPEIVPAVGVKTRKTAVPKPEKDNLNTKIDQAIRGGNFDASIGFDESTTLYVVVLDGLQHVVVVRDDHCTELVEAFPNGSDGYVKAIKAAAAWVANKL